MAASWYPTIIRTRRERIGLSQSDLATSLGVTTSHLSYIEAGKRQATPAQIASISEILHLPVDLLLVASGRMPTDIRHLLDQMPAETAAAVRQKFEAEILSCPTMPMTLPLPHLEAAFSATDIPERINVRKTSASYRAHSYHTKVPPEAIIPFIRAFTRPGDTVMDPFCGSGMTGIAALREGRNAMLSDLSPAAVHIARNYTTFCPPAEFEAALHTLERHVRSTMDWLYTPLGSNETVEYTTWSDVFACSECGEQIRFWDVLHQTNAAESTLTCPDCRKRIEKANLQWLREEPILSHNSSGSNRINTHDITRQERALIEDSEAAPIPYWMPDVPFDEQREMWRASHAAMGISDVKGFFTKRNLHALSALRHAIISTTTSGRIRDALMFAFTACVNRASRRYQWNAKRPTNVMTGTLYIASLRYEWNVWSLFRRKAADVLRYYRQFPETTAEAQVFKRSATEMDCLPDGSVDMVFMDPPFGSNIFYADASLLWEAWLGELTEQADEIVVNTHRVRPTGGKTLDDYIALLTRAFANTARVLKPGGRAILAFSNSDDKVWKGLQSAISDAGFETESVHILDKGQPSIKGVKGVSGKENVTCFDLMMCLKHKALTTKTSATTLPPKSFVGRSLKQALKKGGRIDEIYSVLVRSIVEAKYSVSGITMPSVAEKCKEMGATEQGGIWSLPDKPLVKSNNDDFVAGYLANPLNLPRTKNSSPPERQMRRQQVNGGRSSPYYLAHSYHTKVPPESIAPFIEHFTQSGDVVLDPFAGSGMTGVAAALLGRKAILNDLSPMSAHLSWNHSRPCDAEELGEAFIKLEKAIRPTLDKIYHTTHSNGEDAVIKWMLWSSKHVCPSCHKTFLLWDAIDHESGKVGKKLACPLCKKSHDRIRFEAEGVSQPAFVSYCTADGKRFEKKATAKDVKHALSFTREGITDWYPTEPIGREREMFIRCALHRQNVNSVADMFTNRNLKALALIWKHINLVADDRIKRALAFAFTNTAWHGTRMRRFNAKGGQRPLTGTLYIPQLSSEVNVLDVMRNKISQLQKYYRAFRPEQSEAPSITIGSATNLQAVQNGSIDYIFTDPPFGSNIFYSDCNLVWEAWLGRLTESSMEAVVNKSLRPEEGGKTLADYSDLMADAMSEMARVLKPGGWATVVFHNTDATVWQAIREAAEAAGFSFHEASSLNRKQLSHKGYKGRDGTEDVAHFDVVFNLRKQTDIRQSAKKEAKSTGSIASEVAKILKDPIIASRGLQGVHAEFMRRSASSGKKAFVDFSEIRRAYNTVVAAASD